MRTPTQTSGLNAIGRELQPRAVTMTSKGMFAVAGPYEDGETWFIQPDFGGIVSPTEGGWRLMDLICIVGIELWMRVQKYPGGPIVTGTGPVVEVIARVP